MTWQSDGVIIRARAFWRQLRLPWSALFFATLLILVDYWTRRVGIRPSSFSWDSHTLSSDPAVLGTVVGVVLLIVFGRRMRSPGPLARAAFKAFPSGGYLRWSGGVLLAAGLLLVPAIVQQLTQDRDTSWFRLMRSPLTTAVLACAALLLALYCVYRLRLCYLGRRPGPVEIPLLDDATPAGGAPVKELTLQLRRHLARVHLYPQSLIPGNAPPQEFVALVQSATSSPRNILGTLAGLLTILPSHAYRVHASLLKRDEPEAPFGVSVQVLLRPRWMSRPRIYWAEAWEPALQQAAHAVAEEILPWTRWCREAPWADWMNKELPEGLLDAYQRAKQYVDERRYDEALGAYREALRKDPANLQLRLEVAGLYQKLTLWLDALEMYRDVIVLAERRFLERWRVVPSPQLLAQRRSARRALLSARYRYTISLAWGELLRDQWLESAEAPSASRSASARSKELADLRERLERTIIHHLQSAYKQLTEDQLEALRRVLGPEQEDEQVTGLALRLVFQLMACDEARRLRARFGDARWRKEVGLTRRSRLLFGVWTDLRLAWALHEAEEARKIDDRSDTKVKEALKFLQAEAKERTDYRLPFPPGALKRDVEHRMGRGGSAEWLDHYNVACIYALSSLMSDSSASMANGDGAGSEKAGQDSDDPVGLSVDHLNEAALLIGTDQLSQIRSWIGSEDPDLRGLRHEVRFRRFQARYLPGLSFHVSYPDGAHDYELALHTAQVVRRAARTFAGEWHVRLLRAAPPDMQTVLQWWREEEGAWASLARMARDHQHWQTRLDLIMAMERWCHQHQLPVPAWQHPVFHEASDITELLEGSTDAGAAQKLIHMQIHWLHSRFEVLTEILGEAACKETLVSVTHAWQDYMYELDASGQQLGSHAWRKLCVCQRRLWWAVESWFRVEAVPLAPSRTDGELGEQAGWARQKGELQRGADRLARHLARQHWLAHTRSLLGGS